jgi:hypothetical protein
MNHPEQIDISGISIFAYEKPVFYKIKHNYQLVRVLVSVNTRIFIDHNDEAVHINDQSLIADLKIAYILVIICSLEKCFVALI